MRLKISIGGGYKIEDETFHNVTINNETFKKIPNIAKCKKCTRRCKYYRDCMYFNDGVVRRFDCKRNVNLINRLWNIVTSAVVVFGVVTYYKTWNLGLFKGTSALIISLVVLDILCCIIEFFIKRIRNRYFYKKLKTNQRKNEKKEAIKLQEEIAKQAIEEAKDPNKAKIREAETLLNEIEALSDAVDFGNCDHEIETCVEKCREIIGYLKKDTSSYIRVESLFKVYLPQFYRILSYYNEFKKADAVEESLNTNLSEAVKFFYDFLCRQRIEAIFDRDATEIRFNNAVSSLKKEIEDRGGKL